MTQKETKELEREVLDEAIEYVETMLLPGENMTQRLINIGILTAVAALTAQQRGRGL